MELGGAAQVLQKGRLCAVCDSRAGSDLCLFLFTRSPRSSRSPRRPLQRPTTRATTTIFTVKTAPCRSPIRSGSTITTSPFWTRWTSWGCRSTRTTCVSPCGVFLSRTRSHSHVLIGPRVQRWNVHWRLLHRPRHSRPQPRRHGESTLTAYCLPSPNRSKAYYAPNADRKNLVLLTGAQATRVILQPSTAGEVLATGIEFTKGGETFTARSKLEVILSAGERAPS